MLTDEQRAFLETTSRAFLVVHRGDGSPTCYPMTMIPDGNALVFSTYRKSAKVIRLRRDPRVSVLVVLDIDGSARRSLLIHGVAEVADESVGSALSAGLLDVAAKVPAEVVANVARRHVAGKRCVLRVHPTSVEER